MLNSLHTQNFKAANQNLMKSAIIIFFFFFFVSIKYLNGKKEWLHGCHFFVINFGGPNWPNDKYYHFSHEPPQTWDGTMATNQVTFIKQPACTLIKF